MKNLKSIIVGCFVLTAVLVSSCSGNDYVNVIPRESTALISVDADKMSSDSKMADKGNVIKSLLQVDDIKDCGIDFSKKFYMFESPEGDLGICAKVNDDDDLETTFKNLARKGKCTSVVKRRGFKFTVLKNSWVAGFSGKALLIMGPAVGPAQMELQQKMSRYLDEDEDDGVKGSPMYDRLDSINTPMAMVAQAQSLPEKFIAPFTLGAPKDADASQIIIAAEMTVDKGCLKFNGETFSFNKRIDDALKKAAKIYRPIKGKYARLLPMSSVAGMFMNVDGKQFLPLMQNDKAMVALLAGVNQAIDMDNILRSVNGDLAIVFPEYSGNKMSMTMSAQLANSNWLSDVDYWKQSCPAGGRILDWRKNAYYYTDSKTTYYFGVSPDMQYYSGSSAALADHSIQPAQQPIGNNLVDQIVGKKLVLVINLGNMKDKKGTLSVITTFMQPIFGKVNSIVYSLK